MIAHVGHIHIASGIDRQALRLSEPGGIAGAVRAARGSREAGDGGDGAVRSDPSNRVVGRIRGVDVPGSVSCQAARPIEAGCRADAIDAAGG